MLEERKQNLAETDRGSYYNQNEQLEELLDANYNGIESDDNGNGNMKIQGQLFADVLLNRYS